MGTRVPPALRRPCTLRRLQALTLIVATLIGATSAAPAPARASQSAGGEPRSVVASTDTLDDRYAQPADPAPISVLEPPTGGAPTDLPPAGDVGVTLRPEIETPPVPSERTEVIDQRTERSRVYAEPDGRFTQEVSLGRLNYQDGEGTWQPIDLSLLSDRKDGYDVAVAALDRDVRFALDDPNAALAELGVGHQRIALRALDYETPAVGPAESMLRFAGAGNRGELAVVPTDTGFQFTVTLDGPNDTAVYHFALATEGLRADLDKGTVLLTQPYGQSINGLPSDKVVGSISAPLMLEADRLHPDEVEVSLLAGDAKELPSYVPAELLDQLAPGELLLSYAIDSEWLSDPQRQFPLVLDPTACIGNGASGCTLNDASGSFDEFIFSAQPDYHTVGWEVTRVGYDARSDDGGSYATMRTLFYFPDLALPDGAQVYDAEVRLVTDQVYGGWSGEQLRFYRVTRPWGTNSVTWNDMHQPTAGYEEAGPAVTIPSGTSSGDPVTVNATALVRDWYTRRGADWEPNLGLLLRMVTEGSANGEIDFKKFTTAVLANRPLLTISYALPAPGFEFDPALGPNYAPSGMVAGKTVPLPIRVRNDGTAIFNHANGADGWKYEVGYRWFDADGDLVACPSGTCRELLPGTVNGGATGALFPFDVTAPTTPGQYTLRLDLVHSHATAGTLWASDWARPSLYLSRNKKILSAENTRWVGSSIIERAEFGIAVSTGGGGATGELSSVALGDGSELGINLSTRNLHYRGAGGVGFGDLDDLALTYGYDRANVTNCINVLDACGWHTNFDERFIAGADQGSYTYQSPAGDRYVVGTDGVGQLASAAPVLLARPRITYFDENDTTVSGANLVLASTESPVPAYSGARMLKQDSSVSLSYGTVPTVELNQYRWVSFAAYATAASGVGIDFKIHNVTDGSQPDQWLIYTLGSDFATGSFAKIALGGDVTDDWRAIGLRDLYADALAKGIGANGDVLQVIAMQTTTNGQAGWTYVDAVRFEGRASAAIGDTMPSWTSNGGNASANTVDFVEGSQSVRVAAVPYASSPMCDNSGCRGNLDLDDYPFAHWAWKKTGGSTIGLVFATQNIRTGTSVSITYYAGPTIPPGAPNPVQVSPVLPTEWTRVTRNVLEDARQIAGFYNDTPLGSSPSSPPAGPQPDLVRWTAYRLLAIDGNFALFDDFDVSSLPDIGPDQRGRPSSVGDATFTYDFVATYPDRSRHFFNRDGLLERIADRDGNQTNLDWNISLAASGQGAYTLDKVRAPSDGSTSESWTYDRELDVSVAQQTGYDQVTFTERLGTTATPIIGRRMDFMVADVAGTSHGVGDLLKVSPARHNSPTCGARPSGCVEFTYTNAVNHSIASMIDPRWDGSSGAGDFRVSVGYTGSDPTALTDNSRSATPQLYVVSFDTGTSASLYRRPLVADAAARAANRASYVELAPDGNARIEYVPKLCTTNPCLIGSTGSHPAAPALADRLAVYEFNGLSQVNRVTTFRAPSEFSATRQATRPAAKVDNYADPLAAGRPAWSQTADQYFSSYADSGGTNLDLYRTTYAYDHDGNLLSEVSPVYNRTPDYASAIKSTAALSAHWRLADTGATAADASGGGITGTISATGVTKGATGGLARDPNAAMIFNGTSGRVTAPIGLGQTAYTMEAWVRQETTISDANNHGLIGDRLGTSGALLHVAASNQLRFSHGAANLVPAGVRLAEDRWYHVVAAWDGAVVRLYVDAELVGSVAVTAPPGTGASSFEIASYGDGTSSTFNNAAVDEVALYSSALDPGRIRAHYQAGRGIAEQDRQARYDPEGHPLESHDSFVSNGGFESGLAEFAPTGTANAVFFNGTNAAEIRSGFAALRIPTTSSVTQDAQLVPGQTARLQLAARTDGGGSTQASFTFEYWRRSTALWVTLVSGAHATSTWTTKAFDVTVPMDSDGRVRVKLWNSAASGTAYFDDLLLVSDWALSSWEANGRPNQTDLLQPGSASGAVLKRDRSYAAGASTPPIFVTGTTDNLVDGLPDPLIPDEDVVSLAVYDAWGRVTSATDPDGVTTATTYAANLTDVASSADELGNTTSFDYDAVGNQLSVTAPGGGVTSRAYDHLGRPELITAPDGVVSDEVYNLFGQRTSTIANRRDGTPANQGGDDDLISTFVYDEFNRTTQTIADDGASGLIKAKTTAAYDMTGNQTSASVYADSAYLEARVTTSHVATVSGGVARPAPTGTRGPIPPSGSPAPLCPGSGGQYCTGVSVLDMNGRLLSNTDAYGVVSLVDRDVRGNVVQAIANYVAGASATTERNLTTSTAYDIAGQPVRSTDAGERDTLTTYDDLSRATRVVGRTDAGADHVQVRTVYTYAGRIDRVSDPGPAAAADAALTWTSTEYDAAGRAVRTLAHHDIDGDAHLVLDGFETGTDRWTTTGSGWFTQTGAGLALDDAFHAVGPLTGDGRLRAATAAGSTNTGVTWDLSGQRFIAGRTYRLTADVLAASGVTLRSFFGVDASGASYVEGAPLAGNGAWQSITINWTPAATVTANIHFALRKDAAGTTSFYLDNLGVEDVADPAWNIPTETAFDADGRVVASVLPPGAAGEDALVTTTAYDPAGRSVAVSINARRAYSHWLISKAATEQLTAYWPLDERTGTLANDAVGSADATLAGGYRLGTAGAVDEARTAAALDAGYASRSASALAATNNFSLEAWFRLDTADGNQTIVYNGTDAAGWGLGLDATGKLAAIYGGVATLATTQTPTLGAWHHAVLVRAAGTTAIYLDGTAYTPSSATSAPLTPGGGFGIGRQSAATPRYLDGAVDEVAVYATALSAAAVDEHYDAGRPSTADERLTSRTDYDALGRGIRATSPAGVVTAYEVNRLGRTTATVANLRDGTASGAGGDDDVRSTFAHNAVGELIGYCSARQVQAGGCDPAVAANAQAWHYAYDALGNQRLQVPADNLTTTDLNSRSWTYDPGGRLTTMCDFATGGSCTTSTTRHTDYAYDPLGRQLTERVYAGAGTGSLRLGWTRAYSADSLLTSVAFDGAGSSQGTDTLSYTYDGVGRPDQLKRASTVLTDYAWNADGTLASRADGTLGTSSFTYDWADRLLTASSPLYAGTTGFSWRLDGLLAGRTWPGFTNSLTATYDAAKRPVEMAIGPTSFERTYARDGLVTSETSTIGSPPVALSTNGQIQAFTYDGLGRLVGSDLPGTTTDRAYAYDRNGNRTTATLGATTTTYTFDRSDALVSQTVGGGSPTSYAYDVAGNLTSSAESAAGLTTYTYDAGDRLTGIDPPSQAATSFTFDALGRHKTRVTPAATDTYEYLGTTEVVWRISTGASVVTSAIDAAGNRAATVSGSATGFLVPDLHGNFAAALSPSEAVLNAIRYDGYGMAVGTFTASGAVATPWRYQGRLDVSPDGTTPLYDLTARHYSPGLGTFTQFDTVRGQIANPLSLNRYLYAHASPSTLTDPTGHAVFMKDGPTANSSAYWRQKYITTLAYLPKTSLATQAIQALLGAPTQAAIPSRTQTTSAAVPGAVAGVANRPTLRVPAPVLSTPQVTTNYWNGRAVQNGVFQDWARQWADDPSVQVVQNRHLRDLSGARMLDDLGRASALDGQALRSGVNIGSLEVKYGEPPYLNSASNRAQVARYNQQLESIGSPRVTVVEVEATSARPPAMRPAGTTLPIIGGAVMMVPIALDVLLARDPFDSVRQQWLMTAPDDTWQRSVDDPTRRFYEQFLPASG